MADGKGDLKEAEIIVKEWETVIKTQMHFNEMIIRSRTTGVSVVMAVYGAAALSIGQYPNKFFELLGSKFHVSTAIIFFGLLLLTSIFILDYFYYFRLLLGAVDRGMEIDKAYEKREIDGIRQFGLTSMISKRVSIGWATFYIFIFYGIPFGVGLIFLFIVPNFCP
jgi:hypothetical protein